MIDGRRTKHAVATRLILAMLPLGLGGCLASNDRDILASWYLVDKVPPSPVFNDPPGATDIVAEVDDIYLALVNRGPKEKRIYGLFMNGRELHSPKLLHPGGYYAFGPGEVKIFPTGIFAPGSISTCSLPVRLTARFKAKKRQRPRPIRLIGTMPGALPSEWLDKCR